MLFGRIKNSTRKSIESKIRECNLSLDNNYRDLAKSAYNEAKEMLEAAGSSGALKGREVAELSSQLNRCMHRIEHMGHY